MKLSYNWLREWAAVPATASELTARITLAGLESEAEPMTGEIPSKVVVGLIVKAEKLPQADRLQICEVDVGSGTNLQIVCGAPNARAGLHAPCALAGARLPGGTEIKQGRIRGVESHGMLCSAKELGLSDRSEGLLELDSDSKTGTPIEQYLSFNDDILNLEFTPNRGDAVSVQGLAREVAAIYNLQLKRPNMLAPVVVGHTQYKVEIEDLADCPLYSGRVVSKLNPKARTPDWMREKLRRSGIRAISPVVDVTNYVMLELGQPLHAFDTTKLSGAVRVRRARDGESLTLLNGETVQLGARDLVIAHDKGVLGLAGVMGGQDSGVNETTTSVFLESACFSPLAVAGTGRRHKISSDALYRFERGVDPGAQRAALDRATQLLLQISGGEVHPVSQTGRAPEQVTVRLRHARVKQLLGHDIPAKEIEALLARLSITVRQESGGAWTARVPSFRTDLRIEADLIEEIARIYGYDRIPAQPYRAALAPEPQPERLRRLDALRDTLVARGWQEAVTLSFVEPRVQQLITPDVAGIALDNPLAEQLAVMRTSLWPGLIAAWLYNQQRQQKRTRLFEVGVCFADVNGAVIETPRIAGLAAGEAVSEQWGMPTRATDFHDIKGDAAALLPADCEFVAAAHPALHPGRSARVLRNGAHAGWIGALHPAVAAKLDLPESPFLFELDWTAIREVALPHANTPSEFPSSRRDLAVVVPEVVTAQQLSTLARRVGGNSLQKVIVFDIYRGKALGDGFKSVAFGLIFNDYSRTLNVEEIDAAVAAITQALSTELQAAIRQ
ncbi:MAG TPA: phenylalanine--tRNA ligase subunit beta [Nevskiaceae bacterium]|nr:phenylalanine--tRNA ligase subunit beta [Nevskiaceae bacterium]